MRGTVGGQASRPGKCGRAECRPLVSPEPPTLLPWGGDNVHSPGLAPDATISRRHFAKERILQQAQQLVSRPGRGKIQDTFGTLCSPGTPCQGTGLPASSRAFSKQAFTDFPKKAMPARSMLACPSGSSPYFLTAVRFRASLTPASSLSSGIRRRTRPVMSPVDFQVLRIRLPGCLQSTDACPGPTPGPGQALSVQKVRVRKSDPATPSRLPV